jgi:Mor family transcriptional regulator
VIAVSAERAEFTARILARLVGKGIAQELAQTIADEVAEVIWKDFGGDKVYFRGRVPLDPDQVWTEFNGRNHKKLALKYHCSTSWIRKIVARKTAALHPKVTP